jgi:hypothetical protein
MSPSVNPRMQNSGGGGGGWMGFLAWQHLPSSLQSKPLGFLPSILFSSLVTLQLSRRVQSLPGSWYIKVAFCAEAWKYLHGDRIVSPLRCCFYVLWLIFFLFHQTKPSFCCLFACMVPTGLFCHSCFNFCSLMFQFCSLFKKFIKLDSFIFKIAKWAVSFLSDTMFKSF